jgi:hypothetical protein
MEINFGKYKIRVEILVAILVVFWVMFGHILCSCCKVNLFEGLKGIGKKRGKQGSIESKADIAKRELEKAQTNFDRAERDFNIAKNRLDQAQDFYGRNSNISVE